MITIFNPISKFYNKILQKGIDLGYAKGIKDGQKDGDDRIDKYSNLFEKVFDSKELEIKELKAKLEEKPKESAPWTNDETLLWLNSMAEIIGTKYFNTTLWSNTKANGIKEVIEYIDYLEHTFEIKTTYPQTYSLLPELRKAIGKVYDNKLAVEEAEKLF